MLQPRICLLGLLPFRPIIRIGCRPTPAECGLDRPAARARQIAGVRMTRLHGSAVLGSVRLSLERGDLEPGPVGAPGTSTACLWLSLVPADSHGPAKMRGPARPQVPLRTAPGHERRSDGRPPISVKPRSADIRRVRRHVSNVPKTEVVVLIRSPRRRARREMTP